MVTALVTVAALLVLSVVAVVVGHRGLGKSGPSSAGVGNAFGGFDVFDPARARMKEDLDSKETEGEAFPAPDDDDRPVRVDLQAGRIHIKKTPPAP
ncbi:hypothetical protein [Nocardioides litoris]|uniref:hypothetical protein n=1 Tax=Nocardioides litoris TaxID=1926648 RepID=UPI0011246851|nr:hypothetical protein [Nocardioides litoris]